MSPDRVQALAALGFTKDTELLDYKLAAQVATAAAPKPEEGGDAKPKESEAEAAAANNAGEKPEVPAA